MVNQCSATSSRPKLVAYEMKGMIKMTLRKVEIERFSVTSSKSFEAVVAAPEAAVGHPDISEFGKAIKDARTFAELESTVQKGLGRTGLMIFTGRRGDQACSSLTCSSVGSQDRRPSSASDCSNSAFITFILRQHS